MTDIDRQDDERLDAELRGLPRAIEPGRDLWPGISARLDARQRAPRRRPVWPIQAAAAVLLVAGSSLLTATLLDSDRGAGKMTAAPGVTRVAPEGSGKADAIPAAFDRSSVLDPEYLAARRQLTAMLETRMANMPDSTRAKLEVNLAEMRRAAEQINDALAEQPGDPLLQELLLKTYQDELAVLANVNQLTNAMGSAADAKTDSKRIQL